MLEVINKKSFFKNGKFDRKELLDYIDDLTLISIRLKDTSAGLTSYIDLIVQLDNGEFIDKIRDGMDKHLGGTITASRVITHYKTACDDSKPVQAWKNGFFNDDNVIDYLAVDTSLHVNDILYMTLLEPTYSKAQMDAIRGSFGMEKG